MPSNREWLNQIAADDPQKLNVWFEKEHVDDSDEISKLTAERDELKRQLDTMRDVARDFRDERDELKAMSDRLEAAVNTIEGCDERCMKLEAGRDEWKAKVKTLADYSKYWRGRCAKLEYRNDKRAAAVERLRKMQHVDDYGDWVEAIAEVVKGTDRSNIGDYGMWESLIDLLSDENVGIPYERPRIIDSSEIEAMVANANSKAGPPQPATSIDAQQDTNGTCPDGDETCPNHSKAHSKTEPSLSQLFGILSDDCGQIADMSQKSADCVRSEPEMPEIDEPDTIRNELQDNGYVVMPYHNGEKQAKLMGKQVDKVIFDELHDSREKLESDLQALTERWHDYDGNYMRIYSTVAYAQVKDLLDRQAAITAKRLCSECTPTVAEERDYLRTRVDELNTQVQEQSELIAARGKTIESLERFMSERKLKLKKQLESKTEQYRKLKAERDEYRELYEAAMSTDYGQLSKEHEQFREEISEMLDAAQQIERIAAKHETQSN